jgi:hypothetical protein
MDTDESSSGHHHNSAADISALLDLEGEQSAFKAAKNADTSAATPNTHASPTFFPEGLFAHFRRDEHLALTQSLVLLGWMVASVLLALFVRGSDGAGDCGRSSWFACCATVSGNCVASMSVLETSGVGAREELHKLRQRAVDAAGAAAAGGEQQLPQGKCFRIWLHFGVHAGSQQFALESTAYNCADFRCPDQRGWSPRNESILPACAAQELCTGLDLPSLRDTLEVAPLSEQLASYRSQQSDHHRWKPVSVQRQLANMKILHRSLATQTRNDSEPKGQHGADDEHERCTLPARTGTRASAPTAATAALL